MEIIRALEDAVYKCQQGHAFHATAALDEAVAYYSGSLEEGSGNGQLLYAMANHRASYFRTAGQNGTDVNGTAMVNHNVFREFREMANHLNELDCDESALKVQHIVRNMFVPLIQGTIQYAHWQRNGDSDTRSAVEGATWAATILPLIHACNSVDADVVYQNMKFDDFDTGVDFVAVKQALEKNYKCLRITCEDVGGLWDDSSKKYKTGAEPCDNNSFDTGTDTGAPVDDSGAGADSGSAADGTDTGDVGDATSSTNGGVTDEDIENDFGSAVDSVSVSGKQQPGGPNVGLALGLTVAFLVGALLIMLYVKSRRKQQEKPPMVVFKGNDREIA